MIQVKVKKQNKDVKLPYRKHDSDFCFDLYATSCEEIAPNVYRYGPGLSFEIVRPWHLDKTDINICLSLRPRSSVWKTGMVLSNCSGTIDEQYRGEVMAVFYHVMPDMPKYEVGDRIGQIYLSLTEQIDFIKVEELSDTERGAGGFGSTGK